MGYYATVVLYVVNKEVIIPNKYNDAVTLMDRGAYAKAIEKFETLDGYKDSSNKINECNEAILEEKYNKAIDYMNNKDYIAAFDLFDDLNGYKNSKKYKKLMEYENDREKLFDANVGDTVYFGNFNGNIEWVVLDKQDENMLIISKYAIGEKDYNEKCKSVTWKTSTIRNWLNETYITSAFSDEDQAMIMSTKITNLDNAEYGTSGGTRTTDKVFLLSIDEASKYFSSDRERKTTMSNGETCWWWLRSPGNFNYYATYVESDGEVNSFGNSVENGLGAVRPAMWIGVSDQ